MGHIAEMIRAEGVEPDVVELANDRKELLEAKGFNVVGRDFMDMKGRESFTYGDLFRAPDGKTGIMSGSGGMGSVRVTLKDANGDVIGHYDRDKLEGIERRKVGYDRILMNPPFGDRRDAEHVQNAYRLLNPGGRVVAIMGEGVFFGQDKKAVEFREWLESVGGTSEKLEDGTFLDPSLPVNTGVNARMVVIDRKETDSDVAMFSRKQSRADLAPVDQSVIDGLVAGIPGVRQAAGDARITTVFAPSELSAEVLAEADKQGISHDEIHGVLYKGRAYIVRQNLKTRQDVEEVLVHEVLGHGGVHALLGDSRESVLLESFNRAGGIRGIRTIALRHGVLLELNQRIPKGELSAGQKIAVVDEMLALAQGKQHTLRQVPHPPRRGSSKTDAVERC